MNRTEGTTIRVLVVEDSPVISGFIMQVLNSAPGLEVVGTASDGREALEAVQRLKPHVITMDIHMPRVDGFAATRNIMEICPTPIVIVSGSSTGDQVSTNFHALEAGALAVVARPRGIGHSCHFDSAKTLIDTVKLMSEVKVVRRWLRPKTAPIPVHTPLRLPAVSQMAIEIVAIGASTGGPLVLQTILADLPKDLPVPITIVQHMTPGFTEGFVEWLCYSTGFPVTVAKEGELLLPGHAYVAPDNVQMGVTKGHRIVLTRDARENGMCPAVSFLFRSINVNFGSRAVGVLLTGMGVDGVIELNQLKNVGAVTLVQDKESSVVHGMPGQAIKDGAATHVLSPLAIAQVLKTLKSKP